MGGVGHADAGSPEGKPRTASRSGLRSIGLHVATAYLHHNAIQYNIM